MAIHAEVGRFPLQAEPIIGLVGIMTTDTVSLKHRRVNVILKHHIPRLLMAGKTQFILGRGILKLMFLPLYLIMANRAYPSPNRAVYEFLCSHIGMALLCDTTIVSIYCYRPGYD